VSNRLAINLTHDERHLLVHGLREWGGPTRATDLVARAIGFVDVKSLYDGAERIAIALDAQKDLTPGDWARALIATEIAFASDFYGSGWDWSITAGYDDETTIRRLRSVQRKLIGVAQLPQPDGLSD
jgi:hypothetical protein